MPIVAMTAHALSSDRHDAWPQEWRATLPSRSTGGELIEAVGNTRRARRAGDTGTRGRGETTTRRRGDTGTRRHGDMGTRRVQMSPRLRVSVSPGQLLPFPPRRLFFDPQVALGRLGGNRDLLRDVVEFFFEDSPELLDKNPGRPGDGLGRRVQRASAQPQGPSGESRCQPAAVEAAPASSDTHQGDLASATPLVESLEQEDCPTQGSIERMLVPLSLRERAGVRGELLYCTRPGTALAQSASEGGTRTYHRLRVNLRPTRPLGWVGKGIDLA